MTENDHAGATRAAAGESRAAPHKRRLFLLLTIASVALVVDLLTKIAAVEMLTGREPLRLLDGGLYLTLARNTGAAFSMGSNMTVVFTLVMIVVIAVIAFVARRIRSKPWAISLGLIMGGATGNLLDRVFRDPAPLRGGVVDFLSVLDPWGQVWPIFNVADMCIVTGGVLAVLLSLIGRDIDGTPARRRSRETGQQPDITSAQEKI